MKRLVVTLVIASLSTVGFATVEARAQSAGAMLGGLAGGVLGGVIAGSIIAQSRQRPTVVYQRPRTVVRVARPAPRRDAGRVARAPRESAPTGAALINTSADPFAKSSSPATTAVSSGN